jgi:RNA polymerase subunit RPABC4/transcription elongation factor Spt4
MICARCREEPAVDGSESGLCKTCELSSEWREMIQILQGSESDSSCSGAASGDSAAPGTEAPLPADPFGQPKTVAV